MSAGSGTRVAEVVERLARAGISVSLFLDPDPRQIEAAARLAVDAVELHTGRYAARAGAAAGTGARHDQTDRCAWSARPA